MDILALLPQAGLNGLVIGAMYALMAIGFSLVFGTMRIVNFAHGEFYMIGSFVAFFTYAQWEVPFALTILIAIARKLLVAINAMFRDNVAFAP